MLVSVHSGLAPLQNFFGFPGDLLKIHDESDAASVGSLAEYIGAQTTKENVLDASPTGESFNSRIQHRLGSCLVDIQPLVFDPPFVVDLRHGLCSNPLPSRITWSGLSGRLTGAPSVPGFQLVNDQTASYALDFCLFTCPEFADLVSASFIAGDPQEFSGAAKWQFRFAVTAP